MLIINAIATIGGLTFVLASLLVVANRYLHVTEDVRIEQVEDMLPHTNCGACGYPGCRAFAEALVRGEAPPAKCSVSGPADHARIAAFLGVDVGSQEKRVARLACAGGNNVARNRAIYQGQASCAAAALVAGGGKACFWGCLGIGDCEVACDFDAITMNPNELPVVNEDLCTACGDCVEACPKDLFSIHPVSHRLWVACSSLEAGDGVLEECEVACTACTRCAMDAPEQITMINNLPVVDYRKGPQNREPTQRCPTGAIVWLDEKLGVVKGEAARKVIRKGEIHNTTT
ncbi:Electron transport complex protein rnfB [Novipirellula aureliae]|uniref:Ion-translocating oxidoreductase complex subunit B n=1 Tax=Novipirellula aureliae TaxID=2527966 RepID=A0A5C6E644_9BACT|nr:RnfABCDGE type electron transport complex subunit B [Novipirellula aureliae]TWU43427.1 Electron transport complex protein rnfB [Novipirellula aureliae]